MTTDHFEAAPKTLKMLVPVFDQAQTALHRETQERGEPWNNQHPNYVDVSHILALQAQQYECVMPPPTRGVTLCEPSHVELR
jgi:hypothetical protein